MAKSEANREALVDLGVSYVGRYVHFNGTIASQDGQVLVSFLWALCTWLSERFPMTAFVHASADTKSSGKTIWLETMKAICRTAEVFNTLRTLALARWVQALGGKCTYLLDEAEKLAKSSLTEDRSLLAGSYRKGQKHMITLGGGKFEWYESFCPKAFASIGDIVDVLKDRCIVLRLERGTPKADLWAEGEAAADMAQSLCMAIVRAFPQGTVDETTGDLIEREPIAMVSPDFLRGRDREIWTPIYSVACYLRLSEKRMSLLRRTMVDLTTAKHAEGSRSYHSFEAEKDAETRITGETLLSDCQKVLREGETVITSAALLARLKGIDVAGWRKHGGPDGLSLKAMADMLGRFGIKPGNARIPKAMRQAGEPERGSAYRCEGIRTAGGAK
jgi:Protein of unknown function (DUF3631)